MATSERADASATAGGMALYTDEQWRHIVDETNRWTEEVPDRTLAILRGLADVYGGFPVSQLEHSLQTATRAYRANASDELVLCSLLHDTGKHVSTIGHPAIAAESYKPYLSEAGFQIIRTHMDFQGLYYNDYIGLSRDAHQQHAAAPWYQEAMQFSMEWDAPAFERHYDTLPLAHFEPLIRAKLARPLRGLLPFHPRR